MPIVMIAIDYDPIKAGYISSLAHPGGNITGVFFQQLELTSKRLEICREAVPKATRVAILWDAFSANQLSPAETAAQALGLSLLRLELKDPPYDYEGAIQLVVRRGGNALFVPSSPLRATFYTTGMEHSPTSATGTSWERTPWHAVQSPWDALKHADRDK